MNDMDRYERYGQGPGNPASTSYWTCRTKSSHIGVHSLGRVRRCGYGEALQAVEEVGVPDQMLPRSLCLRTLSLDILEINDFVCLVSADEASTRKVASQLLLALREARAGRKESSTKEQCGEPQDWNSAIGQYGHGMLESFAQRTQWLWNLFHVEQGETHAAGWWCGPFLKAQGVQDMEA